MNLRIVRHAFLSAALAVTLAPVTAHSSDDSDAAPDLTYPPEGQSAPVINRSQGQYNTGNPINKLPGKNDRHLIIDGSFRLRDVPLAEKVVKVSSEDMDAPALPGLAPQSAVAPAPSGDTGVDLPAN